ncbi:MAG: hypothetical protein ACR2QM_10115, partial [Longimicrobiales bacterium]
MTTQRTLRREFDSPPGRVLIVGGEDVQKRIDLIRALSDRFMFAAVGSDVRSAGAFKAAGIPFHRFRMDRGWNPINDFRTYLSLARVIKKLQPDLVHA